VNPVLGRESFGPVAFRPITLRPVGLITSLVAATSARAVQTISSIGDVTRARKIPGTGASTDSLVVIVLYDTSLRRQRPCP
jgi:hypothetical protein